ncbi:SWIM zinc finger protein [Methanobrevibacter cuticularis]|uniref:SWIM zinc finger protein n=1 Tax=Methanobrevibacter cuticularis TaxID=47311 RepID=A0A166EG71_9EURY|nr:SWIM zinc finger family protein [Methanobrevibacter cuticularis]KZX16616.1 SWIM zinc finger protein [Methanobrevibacter cuticularis]
MIKRIKKALEFKKDNINSLLISCEELHFYVKLPGSKKESFVTCVGNLWRCDCEDFTGRGLHKEGSFLCKHILAVLFYLAKEFEKTP